MATIEKELDFLYQKKDNMNKTLLDERIIDVLSTELCNIIPIYTKATANELARGIMSLNNILNKHSLCTTNLVQKDKFFEYWLQAAITFLEDEELTEQLQIVYNDQS